jgi:hypothetical protein
MNMFYRNRFDQLALTGRKFYLPISIIVAWSLPLLATLRFFNQLLDHQSYTTLFFSADALFLPTLYHDLFVWGGKLQDWILPPAPYIFPDMPLFFYPHSFQV